jgi:hypothetical protein
MNEDLEKTLREVPVAPVPDRLDETVEMLVRRFEAKGPRRSDRRVPPWATALACAACAVVGFVSYPVLRSPEPTRSPEPAVIYIENLSGDLPDVLGGGQREVEASFLEDQHSDVRNMDQG